MNGPGKGNARKQKQLATELAALKERLAAVEAHLGIETPKQAAVSESAQARADRLLQELSGEDAA